MDSDVTKISEQLKNAVNLIMNPYVNQEERQAAYKICEEFKESSPLCAKCGLYLCSKDNTHIVRHFGLQLIEHCVRFRWNNLTQSEKLFVKNSALQLLASGTEPILSEQAHIKDALSRIIVEMIKREWPQQWPGLLQELNEVCSKGETQTELVLMIFLRLAEDTAVFQTVPNQRRREIYQAISLNLSDLCTFFLATLRNNYNKYVQLKCSVEQSQKQQALVHCRVAEVVLKTLVGFVEWMPVVHISREDNFLLDILCRLLGDEALQLAAAECLLLVVERKGKVDERKPLLVLFHEDAMSVIFSAMRSAADSVEHGHYFFLKKLCQVLTSLGMQLSVLWGSIDDVKQPSTFDMYLNMILTFAKHPSQVISSYAHSLLCCFFRHPIISVSSPVQSLIPEFVKVAMEKLPKVGFPSRKDSPSCDYSRLEFDSDDDFALFYCRFRQEVLEALKQVTILQPELTFRYGAQFLLSQLNEYASSPEESMEENPSNCGFFVRLEALAQYLDSVCGRLFCSNQPKPSMEECGSLMKTLLDFKTKDPLVLSSLLSCISSLFVFLVHVPEILPSVLEKIFSAVVFSYPGQTKSSRSKAVKNVRRHACSCLVKMCKNHTELLLPTFDRIYLHVKELSKDPEELSQLEKCTLYEALILISNKFFNYDKQSSFLGEIFASISEVWLSQGLKTGMLSLDAFMSLIGLNEAPVEPSHLDMKGINRSHIVYSVNMSLAAIKRSKWPDDSEVAKQGGFVSQNRLSYEPYLRNPATVHVIPLLEGVFGFLRIVNSLHESSAKEKMHAEFSTALDMPESEKKLVFGVALPDAAINKSDKKPTLKMRNFLFSMYENCLHILGSAAQNLGTEFYAMPDLAKYISSCVFSNLEHLPDYRLKAMMRIFLKPLFQYCPPPYYCVIIPILDGLCPFMYQKLSTRWEKFEQQYGNSVGYEDEMTEVQEILENQLHRLLTREYLELLGAIMQNSKWTEPGETTMDEESEQKSSSQSETISGLGVQVLGAENLRPVVVCTFFNAIHWPDTAASLKSLQLCSSLFKQLMEARWISQESEVNYLLQNTLQGLWLLGEHDANMSNLLSLGLLIYETSRPLFPGIGNVLLQIGSCNQADLQKFDRKILAGSGKPPPEKKRKEAFKSLVLEIIGVLQRKMLTRFLEAVLAQESLTLVLSALAICVLCLIGQQLVGQESPGPWGLPYIGFYPFFRKAFHVHMRDMGQKYGDVFLFRITGQLYAHLSSMAAIREAHITKADCFPGRPTKFSIFQYAFEQSLAFDEGETWRVLRKFYVQALRDAGMGKEELAGPIQDSVQAVLEALRVSGGRPLDIIPVLSEHCTAAARHLFFGGTHISTERSRRLGETYHRLISPMGGINFLLAGQFAKYVIIPWIPGYRDMVHAKKEMESQLLDIVREHEENLDPDCPKDLVDKYILERNTRTAKGDPTAKFFTNRKLAASLIQLYGDGSLGIGLFVAAMLVDLAKHPEVQRRMREEMVEAVGPDRVPLLEDRARLPYTNACLKELYRCSTFFPVAPSLECARETTVHGVRIPKGTVTLVNSWAVHHDPSVYEHPERFDPERFVATSDKPKVDQAPITFGVGKRGCAGESLTSTEVFAFVAAVVKQFNLIPVPKKEGDPENYEEISLKLELRATPVSDTSSESVV